MAPRATVATRAKENLLACTTAPWRARPAACDDRRSNAWTERAREAAYHARNERLALGCVLSCGADDGLRCSGLKRRDLPRKPRPRPAPRHTSTGDLAVRSTALHLLDVFTGLVVLGLIVEVALGKLRHLYSPQLPFLAGFIVVCLLRDRSGPRHDARRHPREQRRRDTRRSSCSRSSTARRTLPRLRMMIWAILLLGAFVSVVAVHQGT